MMVHRRIEPLLREVAARYPVVTVTGPRQSGKTTLCRGVFPSKPYVSLEDLDERERATKDPRGFLRAHRDGAVFDEIQHTPELLSYLQVEVDERPEPGRFILTGSQHFGLVAGVSQSLAGRTSVLTLLPLSLDELLAFDAAPVGLWPTVWSGSYPRIFDRGISPSRWLGDYAATYVQRDVRQVLNIGDLTTFTTFLRLCAGRTAQELNLTTLGSDVGVSHNTIRSWLSVLEASYILFRLPAWHRNERKQWIKAPKLHFYDSGLACYLLGIAEPAQLQYHPMRGALFESWVASEIVKQRLHRGLEARVFHVRETRGVEVDVLVDGERKRTLVEVKSGETLSNDVIAALSRHRELVDGGDPRPVAARMIYGGDRAKTWSDVDVVPWSSIQGVEW